jgi:hypothetical protein
MTTQAQTSAIVLLNTYNKKTKIADLYNDDDHFSSALTCLIPDFEYPNFSYLTIGEVLSRIEKTI